MAASAAPPRPAQKRARGADYGDARVPRAQYRWGSIRAGRFEAEHGCAGAAAIAADATGLPANRFPSSCPHTVEEPLDNAFFPGPIDEKR